MVFLRADVLCELLAPGAMSDFTKLAGELERRERSIILGLWRAGRSVKRWALAKAPK